MRNSDFADYQYLASCYNYNQVPYTQLSVLEIRKGFLNIGYKTSHTNKEFNIVDIKRTTRTIQEGSHMVFPDPKTCIIKPELSVTKTAAIKAMLPYMPQQDREYYKAVIPNLVTTAARAAKQKSGKAKQKGNSIV